MKGKKVIAVLLCSGLALSVVACESDSDKSSTKENETSIETTTEDTTEVATLTEEEITETTEITTTSEEETTESIIGEQEIVLETVATIESDKPCYQYGPVLSLPNEKFEDVAEYIDLKELDGIIDEVIYEDESTLSEGPTLYYYAYADVSIEYPGSDDFPGGVIIVTNVRCILDTRQSPSIYNSQLIGHHWTLENDPWLDPVFEKFCADHNNIGIGALGIGIRITVQRVYDHYWASYRYNTNWSKVIHELDGDFYY